MFLGEPFQREQARKETIQALEAQQPLGKFVFEGNKVNASELREALFAPSLFEPGRWVLIRRVDEFPDAKTLLRLLEKGLPQSVYALLDAEKFDKRSTLFKWLKAHGTLHEFAPLDRRALPGKVKALLLAKKVKISTDAFQYLLSVVPPDLLHIGHEIEKLALYASRKGELDLEDVQGLLFGAQQANVFQFFDALGARKAQALGQLTNLLGSGEEPSKLFYMLANHMRSLLLVKSLQEQGLKPPQIAKQSGLAPWMIERRLQQVRQWTQNELIEVIHRLHEEDVLFKRGQRDPEASLVSLILDWTHLLTTPEKPKEKAWT